MIKISKTRLLTILIVMFVLLCTTSCKSCFNKYEEMPNGITLTVSNKLKDYNQIYLHYTLIIIM